MRPNNAATVLDTHDGIGVIGIGSDQLDRSLKGLVPDEDVDNLARPVVQTLNALCRFRNTMPAFDGRFSHQTNADGSVTLRWDAMESAGGASFAELDFAPNRGVGVSNDESVVTLRWRDTAGEHEADDLIANPPVFV